MEYFIGIDIGTTNAKAVAMSTNGKIMGEERAAYPSIQKTAGQFEQDPRKIFNAVRNILQKLVAKMKAHQPVSVGFSSAMHGIMAVDKNGNPLTNLITWADTRSAGFAGTLAATEEGRKIYRLTGTPIHAMSPLCKLIWLRNDRRRIWTQAFKFVSVKEYIFFRLFGKWMVDHSIASATGLFNIRERQWCTEALSVADIGPERLSEPLSVLHSERERISSPDLIPSIPRELPFILGGNDGCLANLGTGAIEDFEAAVTIGTSGALRMVTREPVFDPDSILFNYLLDEEYYVSGGPINNGGVVLKWLMENIFGDQLESISDVNKFVKRAFKAPAGSGGLVFLPYLLGERAPVWDGKARGAYVGLGIAHGREHLMRSAVEGISFALLQILVALEAGDSKVKRIFASGGFLQSPSWLQLLADIFKKEILHVSVADASAIGACMMAMKGSGRIRNWKEAKNLLPNGKVYKPDLKQHKLYQPFFDIYSSLYAKLKDSFHQLSGMDK